MEYSKKIVQEYHQEILEENKEIIEKYVYETTDKLFFVMYYPGRDYTFGYDYVNVYFKKLFQALIFLMKHAKECGSKLK